MPKRTIILMVGIFAYLSAALMALAQTSSAVAGPEQGSEFQRYQLTGASLTDIDAVSGSDAWAVGSDGLFAHWDGTNWNAVDNTKLIGVSAVQAVDMLATDQVWASVQGGRMARYNGSSWVLEPTNYTANMNSISMVSPTDGWATGANATFARYNGTNWQEVRPSGTLTVTMQGIDMVSSTDGWAVGGQISPNEGPLGRIARWNGTNWQEFPTPVGNRILYDVDMLNASYGWAVGQGGTLLQWNGSQWSQVSPPNNCRNSCLAANMQGVSVVSTTDAWAVGSTNISDANLWHWDGNAWTEVAHPNEAPLRAIKMLSSTDGFAAGERGTVHRFNGSAWQVSNSHWTTNGFYGLDFLNANDGWAVGVLNTDPPAHGLQRWNGTTWEIYQPPFTQPTMYDVDMVASDAVWAVGTSGYIFRWNGTAWSRDTSPNVSLYALSMVSATDGWAVGGSGNIVRFNGTSWTNYTSPTTTNLWSIDMVDANEGWAGGTSGLMLHYQNGTWTRLNPNPTTYTIEGIHMLNANEGWAIGYNGTILHYLNGTWTPQVSNTTVNLLNVYMIDSQNGYAVGPAPSGGGPATMLRYSGGTWTPVSVPTGRTLRDVHVLENGTVWAVSESPGAKIYRPGTAQLTPTPTRSSTPVPPTSTIASTSTSTSVPPTSTATVPATATNTVVPTATQIAPTLTPQPSATQVPPSATPIASTTPVVTNTPGVPPTFTHTSTVVATATSTACALTFTDVPNTHTFYASVRCLACRGIVSGYADGTFRPDNLVTRGQLAKIVSNAAAFTEPPGSQIFQDVAPDHTFYEWINRLTNRGYMSGYTCGSPGEPCVNNRPYFRPFNNATRAQTSKIVSNAVRYNDPPAGQTFEDVPPTHPFYTEIQRLASRNIMGGYECGGPGEPCVNNRPYFRPYNDVTRGQSAKIVANTFYPDCQTP